MEKRASRPGDDEKAATTVGSGGSAASAGSAGSAETAASAASAGTAARATMAANVPYRVGWDEEGEAFAVVPIPTYSSSYAEVAIDLTALDDIAEASGCQPPERYIESLYGPDAQLEEVRRSLVEHVMPDISVAPGYGRLLTLLVRMCKAERVLEIGALGGASGICLARGLGEGGRIVSLELKPAYAELARANMERAGCGCVVEYRVGEALDSLQRLHDEDETFDFFFIDADKGNYVHYLEWAIRLARPGAMIVADNVFQGGKALNPRHVGRSAQAMREFNRRMASDPRLQSAILPAYDGLCIAVVR